MVSEGKFEGRWGYCDTAPIFAWNGHQVSFTSDVTKTLSSKQQRVKIQKSLNFFGFNAGSPDGVFGKKELLLVDVAKEGFSEEKAEDCCC